MKILTVLGIVWGSICCIAVSPMVAQDSTSILTYPVFLEMVMREHPIAQQADLQQRWAAAEMLSARGGFDPKFYSSWDQKQFDSKDYYRVFSSKLVVPTQLPIDVVAGYENNNGEFLNPENSTTNNGLWSAGVEANLLQGLLIDERRATLRQAAIYADMAENERQLALMGLAVEASEAYRKWQLYYFKTEVYQRGVELAELYLEATKEAFFGGEKTAVDTLEASLVLQDRQLLLRTGLIDLVKAQQKLENHLWQQQQPLLLQENVVPEEIDVDEAIVRLTEIDGEQLLAHPELYEKLLKDDFLAVEERWKREKLKPKLKVKFNPLLATDPESVVPRYEVADYKWGVSFSTPLLWRKERADIQRTEIKRMENQLDLDYKTNYIRNKLDALYESIQLLYQQSVQQRANVEGYARLLEAEQIKFNFGESSVFLLNKRQEKYIDGQVKLLKLENKIWLSYLYYQYYANGFQLRE